jgi:hypothetical protein
LKKKTTKGEAIAFALGGSKRMLRAPTLAALINETARRQGEGARVTLHFAAAPAAAPPPPPVVTIDEACDGKPSTTTSSSSSSTQVSIVLSVRRTVHNDGSTASHVRAAPAGAWQPMTQAQLQQRLAPLGIRPDAIDRCVVAQTRLTAGCADPLRLLAQLEAMLGAFCDSVRIVCVVCMIKTWFECCISHGLHSPHKPHANNKAKN